MIVVQKPSGMPGEQEHHICLYRFSFHKPIKSRLVRGRLYLPLHTPRKHHKICDTTLIKLWLCDRNFSFMDELHKFFDKHRIKLRTAVFFKLIDSVFHRKRLLIRTFGGHCIKTVCNRENPCHIRNILAGKSAGITGAVITLMVTSCDFCRMRDQGYIDDVQYEAAMQDNVCLLYTSDAADEL